MLGRQLGLTHQKLQPLLFIQKNQVQKKALNVPPPLFKGALNGEGHSPTVWSCDHVDSEMDLRQSWQKSLMWRAMLSTLTWD